MTEPLTIAAELRERARVLREERTWVQGMPGRPGQACIHYDYELRLREALSEDAGVALLTHLRCTPICWQDTPGRTLDEVCAALIGCAETLEERP